MARLPFNPDRIPEPSAARRATGVDGSSGEAQPMSVSQANRLVKDTLARSLPAKLRIVGQVSNFNDRGHWYFSLKDAGASLRCVCFASTARRSRLRMTDGLEVVVTGRFDVYDAQGALQFYVDKLEPVGQGALELAFRALCDELRARGYFDEARKRPLPVFPCHVAVVTSHAAAALQDVVNTAARRWAGCRLSLVDVRVQGAEAAGQIAGAIEALSRHGRAAGVDAIILTRGGGSIEDLWAFNERIVADAIFNCTMPIVAAIGHETDTTIAELVADVRASTPTQAAMTLIPDMATWRQQLQSHQRRMQLLMGRLMEHARHRTEAAARHALFRRPENMLGPLSQRLDGLQRGMDEAMGRAVAVRSQALGALQRHLMAVQPGARVDAAMRDTARLAQRLEQSIDRRVRMGQDRLTSAKRHLQAVGPASVLTRGYTYTLDSRGRPVTSAGTLAPGDVMTTMFSDGQVVSRVTDDDGKSAATTPPAASAPAPSPVSRRRTGGRKKSSRTAAADQGGLFAQLEPSEETP